MTRMRHRDPGPPRSRSPICPGTGTGTPSPNCQEAGMRGFAPTSESALTRTGEDMGALQGTRFQVTVTAP